MNKSHIIKNRHASVALCGNTGWLVGICQEVDRGDFQVLYRDGADTQAVVSPRSLSDATCEGCRVAAKPSAPKAEWVKGDKYEIHFHKALTKEGS